MMKKRYLITGIIETGDFIRLVLYPDEPVKKKQHLDFMAMAMSGDPSEMQKQAIIQGIISNNPPTLYITTQEYLENKINLHEHITLSFEVE